MSSQPARKVSLREAFFLARKYQSEGKLRDARMLYERLLSFMPNHAEALTLLGSITYQSGDDLQADAYIDRSIEIYRRRLQEDPTNLANRASLVNQLLARGRTDEALEHIGELRLQLNPIRTDAGEFQARRSEAIQAGRRPMVVNTMPKSASETIWNRLAAGLGMVQSHLSMGIFPLCEIVPYRVDTFVEGGVIAKEHIPASPHNLAELARGNIDRMVLHIRDPRQAALSWAHFVRDDVSMRMMAPIWRKVVPPANVLSADFEKLVDWCIDVYMPQLIRFVMDWKSVSDDLDQPIDVKIMSFEGFRSDPEGYFEEILDFYAIDRASFDGQALADDIHYRRGEVDEWREVFTRDQKKRAWHNIPAELARTFGWER